MKYIKLLLANTILFIVLLVVFYLVGFSLGFASNDTHKTASWFLYSGFVCLHLIINIALITKPKAYTLIDIVITCLFSLILYGIIAYMYR